MPDVMGVPTPVVVTVGDRKITLRRLSSYDRAHLLGEQRKRQREQMARTLADAGITGADLFATLNEFDATIIGQQHWIAYVNDIGNEPDILRAALRGAVASDEIEKVILDIDLPIEMKATICGLSMVTRSAAGGATEGETNDPNLNPPPTYSTGSESETTPKSDA